MPQTIALEARAPQIDLAAIEQNAQQARARDFALQNAPARSQLEGLKLNNDIGAETALSKFNTASGAGDPNALDALKGQPALQKQMYDAFDGMSPQDFQQSRKKADAFGRAAQYVLSLPKGTPQQAQAWHDALHVLHQAGYIDDSQRKQMDDAGPSDLILNQALTVGEYVKQYTGRNAYANDVAQSKIDVANARVGELNAREETLRANGGATDKASIAQKGMNLRAARREISDYVNNNAPTPEELAAKTQEVMDFYGLTSADTGGASPDTTQANPVPSPKSGKAPPPDIVDEAKRAIAGGAKLEDVKKRLEDNGYDTSGM
jgi:hypothetical protein